MSTATKHTPGPWHIRTLENFGYNVVHYNNGDKFDLARVAKTSDEANARLIGAAPDLLAALQEQVASCWSVDCELCAQHRAIIAKATGDA